MQRRCLAPEMQPGGGIPWTWVVVMRRHLVVANQTLQAAGGALPHPGMWWWATSYARPATDEEATAQARQRLSLMLAGLAGMGAPVEGDLGSSSPLEAMGKVLAEHQFDEIIVATLPRRISRWLGGDLPHQAERRFGLPVTTIITGY